MAEPTKDEAAVMAEALPHLRRLSQCDALPAAGRNASASLARALEVLDAKPPLKAVS